MTDPSPSAVPSLEPPYGPRDPRDMAALVAAIPEHIERASEAIRAEPWRLPISDPDLLAVGGMGGSAIAGELTAALGVDRMPRPMLIVRDYHWPASVGGQSLALLSSNSGNTEETLALDAEARSRGVPRVAMASGGTLAERCTRDGVHLHRVPGGMPPRAALFHSWVPLTELVHALRWTPDPAPAWGDTAALLRERARTIGASRPEGSNPAKQLARAIAGRLPFVYSAPGGAAAAATRWRQQFNENAKLHAHSAAVPELNHNEIVGWQSSGDASRSIAVLVLRDAEDSAEASLRLSLTAEYADRQGAAVHEIAAVGGSRIARLASLVQFGDYLSLYLALLGGVDPTDIASIDAFKRRLAETRPRA